LTVMIGPSPKIMRIKSEMENAIITGSIIRKI
jgi:hypothetical protein